MMFPQIRCFHSTLNEQPFTFFILTKGVNAGKPGLMPWSNCFSVKCNNKESFDYYFWLVYGLYKANKFKARHRGSVIQFVNLKDIRDILMLAGPGILKNWQQFQQIMKALDLLEKSKTTLGQQLLTTENLQRYLIQRFFEKYE